MQVSVNKIGWLPTLLPAVLAFSLSGSPAKAEDARSMGHRLIEAKVLHGGSGRYEVKFITTDTAHNGKKWTRVSGRGSFKRRGRSSQNFFYHAFVNPLVRGSYDVGYEIR